jgi:hypothetical protein
MRSKTIFGALLVSVALCSQGFGFELLDRMLGLNCGGCGEYKACAKVACCEPAAKACCPEPACCAKPACCEKACGHCNKCRCTPVRDLFAGLHDLFECKGVQCDPCGCQAAKGCCPEPAVCGKACGYQKACGCEKACKVKKCRKVHCGEKACGACDPACAKACGNPCEKVACEPVCEPKCHKLYRRPVVELLEALFGDRPCGQPCGQAVCGDCGGAPAPKAGSSPTKAQEQPAPLPTAPKSDPSASIPSRGIYQAARGLARN